MYSYVSGKSNAKSGNAGSYLDQPDLVEEEMYAENDELQNEHNYILFQDYQAILWKDSAQC